MYKKIIMKLSFWIVFGYIVVAILAAGLWGFNQAIMTSFLDIVLLVALITKKSSILKGESLILLLFFISNTKANGNIAEIIANAAFIILMIASLAEKKPYKTG